MASHWEKVDPDSVVDRLPQPYRTINKVIEDVLSGVEEGIVAIEARRRSEEYEFNLQQAPSSGYVAVHGRVTCTYVEPQGTSRLVVGTGHGEVVLIDTRTQKVVAQKHAFGDTEAVRGVALCSDGRYWEDPSLRPCAKVVVAGTWTPRVLIYDVCRQQYGVALVPACVVCLPRTDEEAPAEGQRIVHQLHAKAAIGLVWVVVALSDGTVRVYACPLGPPESRGRGRHDSVEPIREDEEEVEPGPATGEEFAGAVQVETPAYCFQVPSLAPMPGMAEPRLDALGLTVFAMCPEGRNTARARHTAGVAQEPLHVFVSSSASNVIAAYSLRAPERPAGAVEGDDAVGELLKQAPTKAGDLSQPAEPASAAPRRRWMLPANTTAVAVSSNGAIFAAGGAQGSLALVNTCAGPWLNNMLPGHYAAVAALSFHKSEILVSFGADSWVHHYCTKTDTMLFRCLCAPPPSPPPAVSAVASQTLPLALTLDAAGGLRLLDLGRGSKIARPVCAEQFVMSSFRAGTGSPDTTFFPADGAGPLPPPESARQPSQLLAHAEGFCVLCQADAAVPATPPAAADDGEAGAGGGADAAPDGACGVPGGPPGDAEQSTLFFFDQSAVLPYIFPGVAARLGTGEALEKFFAGLSAEELLAAPPPARPPAPPTESAASPLSRSNTRPGMARSMTRLSQTSNKSARFSVADRAQGGEESNGAVALLTAENLRKMAKPSLGKSLTSAHLGSEPTEAETAADPPPPGRQGAHAPPEAWQASVRRRLRSTTAEKDSRQYRLRKRVEQIRKDIGDA